MDIISIAVLAGLAIALICYSMWPKKQDGRDAVRRRLEGRSNSSSKDPESIQKQARESATRNLVKRAQPMLSRIIMPVSDAEQSQLRTKLTQAGYRAAHAQTAFLAAKTAAMILMAIIGAVAGTSLGFELRAVVLLAVFAGGVGFVLPGIWLSSAVKSRQDKIRRGLPDILDLLVVSVESGLALDAGIKRVGEEMAMVHPDLSEEFRIATMESQMGIPRSEALDNMATRAGVDELRSLISVISQAERFGTSISKALRNQGTALRTKRFQEAEERAQKTAVKLMIPLVMFIFPAMGIVLAGPAALRLMEAFSE